MIQFAVCQEGKDLIVPNKLRILEKFIHIVFRRRTRRRIYLTLGIYRFAYSITEGNW